ncbi:MAG: cytidylate kinase-like family protein [Rikenellaceae bacterium]
MDRKIIINLGRQLGSGGRVIGQRVAHELGVDFYDKKLLQVASKQSGISDEIFAKADERCRRKGLSTFVSYLRNPFAGGEATANNVLSHESLFAIQSAAIQDIAQRGSALFVGRCADYILREEPCCINIFITADNADRIARIVENYNVSPSQAQRMIEQCDESRADYYNFFTTRKWGSAQTYDLCVNSSKLGEDKTVELIVDFVRRAFS